MEVRHVDPASLGEAAEAIRSAVESRSLLVVLANCWVEYEGRAASKSTPGDLVVIVKPDGAVIVHGPRGYKPQNWQPDTSAVTVEASEGELVLRAVRRRPREVLVLHCGRVYHVAWGTGVEEASHWLYTSEREMRDAIASNPSLLMEGFRVARIERPVEPGFIDLYGYDSEGNLVVVELKRVKAGESAVRQLLRYVEALEKKGYRGIRPVLAAPDFTEAAVRLASQAGVELVRLDLRRIYEAVYGRSRRRKSTLDDFL